MKPNGKKPVSLTLNWLFESSFVLIEKIKGNFPLNIQIDYGYDNVLRGWQVENQRVIKTLSDIMLFHR